MGPKHPRSTALSAEEEATAVAFGRHTLLPLGHRPDPAPPRRAGKVCYAEPHEQARRATAVGFLRAVIEAFPYEPHSSP